MRELKIKTLTKTVPAIVVESPDCFSREESYRELYLNLNGYDWYLGVFFLLPRDHELNAQNWSTPVLLDDPAMLYVPYLKDDSIVDAVKFILSEGREFEFFQKSQLPTFNQLYQPSMSKKKSEVDARIRQFLFQACELAGMSVKINNKQILKSEISKHLDEVISTMLYFEDNY